MGLGLDAHSVKVPIRSIVEGAPLRNMIFYTLRGNIDGGLSFTKSLDVAQYNVAERLSYTLNKYFYGVN